MKLAQTLARGESKTLLRQEVSSNMFDLRRVNKVFAKFPYRRLLTLFSDYLITLRENGIACSAV